MKNDRKQTSVVVDDAPMSNADLARCKFIRPGAVKNRRVTLAALRITQGFTQGQIAKRAGITQSEVSRAELREDCRVSTLERYAKALGGTLTLTVEIDGRKYPVALAAAKT